MEKILERLGLTTKIVDEATLNDTVKRFKERKITLPTFDMLANPAKIPADIKKAPPNFALPSIAPTGTPFPKPLARVTKTAIWVISTNIGLDTSSHTASG